MADTPTSEISHESGDEQNANSKGHAAKDKECQYCHQHFTSSSLGRHLDQFISKKKPDGIHDVDEIRRLRGGITRRVARGGKKEQEDRQSAKPSPASAVGIPSITPSGDSLNKIPPSGYEMRFNRFHWHATGVITDPNTLNTPVSASPAIAASPSNKKRSFSTFAYDTDPHNTVDNARALELSLREVLDALRAANKHATPTPSPFKFDINTQTFPSLCLAMLPTPPTLFQSSPFSTLQTVSINPPGPEQLQPLRQKLTATIDSWKWNSLRLAQPTTSNIAEEAAFLTRSAAEYTESALSHLDTCYQNWMAHHAEIRDAIWNLELMRAFKQEQDRAKELEERVEQIQQEATQLQQQVEYLSRCQWPREMALWPPEKHVFDKPMREEIRLVNLTRMGSGSGGDGADDMGDSTSGSNIYNRGDKWDFDRLVNKWKARVKEDRTRRAPFVQAQTSTGAGGGGGRTGGGGNDISTPVNGGAGGIHPGGHEYSREGLDRKTETPPVFKSKSESDLNGIQHGGSPLVNGNDERRKPMRPMKNISVISDL